MKNDIFSILDYDEDVKVKITADELLKVMKNVANQTANYLLAKMNVEPSLPVGISRKEAMKILKVTSEKDMILCEEKGYLQPHRSGRQIYYLQDEVLVLQHFAELLIFIP